MIRDAVILKEQPDIKSFKQFIKELGGRWTISPTVSGYEYGVIKKWGALVMLELADINEPYMDFDESEMDLLRKHLARIIHE